MVKFYKKNFKSSSYCKLSILKSKIYKIVYATVYNTTFSFSKSINYIFFLFIIELSNIFSVKQFGFYKSLVNEV